MKEQNWASNLALFINDTPIIIPSWLTGERGTGREGGRRLAGALRLRMSMRIELE